MKPLNNDDPGCNFTTSNCVIWQGPDIECIKLCKGDTVSDVVYKLATELCGVLDILKISNYELGCFNITSCAPKDFEALINFLIGRICQLEACNPDCVSPCVTNGTTPTRAPIVTGSGCPDCVVAIAPCFYYINQFGDQVTTMQLTDYVLTIGNYLCNISSQITTINLTLNSYGIRITELENAPPPAYIPPTVIPSCVLPSVPQQMNVLLGALETQFCQLRQSTGLPNDIYSSIAYQCTALNTEIALNGSGSTMASLPGWTTNVTNLAESFGNMWLTLCDMRQAIKTIQLNCCPSGCDGIALTLYASISGDTLSVFVNGTIPSGFLQCSTLGTQFRVTDSNGNFVTFYMDIISYLNIPTGQTFSLALTPVNSALDLTIVMEPCLTNPSTNATCESYLSYTIDNLAACPVLSYTVDITSIQADFTTAAGNYTYDVQLWDALGSTLIDNMLFVSTGIASLSALFTSLTASTIYRIRVVVTATACPTCESTVCPFFTLETNPVPCLPPDTVIATIII